MAGAKEMQFETTCKPLFFFMPFFMHAGVLGFEEDGGFYLLHSTPNFPDVPADDVYHGE